MGPIETSISGANHAVSHAQNDRRGMGPIEPSNSDPKGPVFNAKKHRLGLGPIETGNSDANHFVLQAQEELMLITLFCMQQPQMRAGTHRD